MSLINRVIIVCFKELKILYSIFVLKGFDFKFFIVFNNIKIIGIIIGEKFIKGFGKFLVFLFVWIFFILGRKWYFLLKIFLVIIVIIVIGIEISILYKIINFKLVFKILVMVKGFGVGGINMWVVWSFIVNVIVIVVIFLFVFLFIFFVNGDNKINVEL